MEEKLIKRQRFLVNLLFFGAIAALIALFFRYIVPLILPFLIGFVIASIVRPLQKFFSGKLKTNNKCISTILVTLLYAVVIFCLYLLLSAIIGELVRLYHNLPALLEQAPAKFGALSDRIYNLLSAIHPELGSLISDGLGELASAFTGNLSGGMGGFLSSATSVAMKLPNYFITTVVSIISGYLISANYDAILAFLRLQLPARAEHLLDSVYNHLAATISKMLKAYALILSVTFAELTIGFLLLGIEYAVLIAFVTAIIDILPILGVGTVLIPWGLISLIMGNFKLGIGLLILYVVILAIRQYLEPKIVGAQLGLHPLVTLGCIYAGFKVAGLLGMLSFPILMILIKKLNDEGEIHLWRIPPERKSKRVQP